MTKEQNSTTLPSPELRAKWRSEAPRNRDAGISLEDYLMDRAAEWSANQLIEACCETILDTYSDPAVTGDNRLIDKHVIVKHLRSSLGPKPLSLKQRAQKALQNALVAWTTNQHDEDMFREYGTTINRALEQLPDD